MNPIVIINLVLLTGVGIGFLMGWVTGKVNWGTGESVKRGEVE